MGAKPDVHLCSIVSYISMGACRSAICEYIGEVIDEVRLGCSIVSCYEYSGEFLTHSFLRAVGCLSPAGSRVGFLLCITVTSHDFAA